MASKPFDLCANVTGHQASLMVISQLNDKKFSTVSHLYSHYSKHTTVAMNPSQSLLKANIEQPLLLYTAAQNNEDHSHDRSKTEARSLSTKPTRKCCWRKSAVNSAKLVLSPPTRVDMKDDWLVEDAIDGFGDAGAELGVEGRFITEDQLVKKYVIDSQLLKDFVAEIKSLHFVRGFQFLQHLQLIRAQIKAFLKNLPDSCFRYFEFLTGTLHRFSWTASKCLANGFHGCSAHWRSFGTFLFAHTDLSNKALVPSTNCWFTRRDLPVLPSKLSLHCDNGFLFHEMLINRMLSPPPVAILLFRKAGVRHLGEALWRACTSVTKMLSDEDEVLLLYLHAWKCRRKRRFWVHPDIEKNLYFRLFVATRELSEDDFNHLKNNQKYI
ncbi:hypothetical protein J437_LFUL018442 [Ladona fulva]|uniref:Uncharacterized protein n=1 Tax=Ladona fulva TaxID=123851 RepID=A0A8K0P9E9_LADFU|nr:hypothetical protein J437_LFUL018442 [Ladona fulva]